MQAFWLAALLGLVHGYIPSPPRSVRGPTLPRVHQDRRPALRLFITDTTHDKNGVGLAVGLMTAHFLEGGHGRHAAAYNRAFLGGRHRAPILRGGAQTQLVESNPQGNEPQSSLQS